MQRLADELRALPTGRRQTVADSMDFIVARRHNLVRWETIEDLAFDAFENPPSFDSRAMLHHFERVRATVAAELYARQIFVGGTVLDDLLFSAARDPSISDPLLATLEFLRDKRVNRPGLVVLPLHGFGIVGAGAQLLRRTEVSVLRPEWRLALTPQTNNMAKTVAWLEAARRALGVRKAIPTDALHHYRRSRARWLDHNPLIAVQVVNVAGQTYENQRLLMDRVRAATGVLALAAALQPQTQAPRSAFLFSTSSINNFETLDIGHYVVFSDSPASRSVLESKIVPLNLDREDVYELTDLSIELDPSVRGRRRAAFELAEQAVEQAYAGYLRYHFDRDDGGARGRAYRKAFDSLNYFRRTFRASGGAWSATVSLAIAFEILLTDSYSRGVTEQIVRRTGLLLRGVPYKNADQRHVRDLFSARGDIVHRGVTPNLDLVEARRTYARVLSRLVPRLSQVASNSTSPLRDATGDAEADDDS